MLFIVSLVVLFNSYIYWNVNAENFLNARILFMLLLVKKIEDNFLTLKINVDLFAKKVSKSRVLERRTGYIKEGNSIAISNILESGAFVEKGINTYDYYLDGGKVYETDITNENDVTLAFYLDTQCKIIGQFERTASNNIRLLTKEYNKRLDLRSYSNHTYNGQLINGCCMYT